MVLDVEFEGANVTPWGTTALGFSASTEIDREEWGVTYNQVLETGGVMVGKKIRIELQRGGRRPLGGERHRLTRRFPPPGLHRPRDRPGFGRGDRRRRGHSFGTLTSKGRRGVQGGVLAQMVGPPSTQGAARRDWTPGEQMTKGPREDERSAGRSRRAVVPRSAHGDWKPSPDRPDPIDVLAAQNQGRIADLVPVRWGRMLESPFAFLRGAAVASWPLTWPTAPVSGIGVQACGDAHVANFGVFASPERILLFDVNDFDETLPGPFEWDLLRLATSAVVAARTAGLGERWGSRRPGPRCARTAGACTSTRPWVSWTSGTAGSMLTPLSALSVNARLRPHRRPRSGPGPPAYLSGGPARLTALSGDGARRIVDHPPLVTHDLASDETDPMEAMLRELPATRSTTTAGRLLDRFTVGDVARKVVGVGSVGTRCFIALLTSDVGEPLFLQVKEAEASVLAGPPHPDQAPGGPARAPTTRAAVAGDEGRRVVDGQRLMQAASDIFLGSASCDGRDYYVRQLRDMKGDGQRADPRRPRLWSAISNSAGGPWRGPTPAPDTARRDRRLCGPGGPSRPGRVPASPWPMPTRPSVITPCWWTPCGRAGSRPHPGSDGGPALPRRSAVLRGGSEANASTSPRSASSRTQSPAAAFASTWARLVAPAMTEATSAWHRSHDTASSKMVWPVLLGEGRQLLDDRRAWRPGRRSARPACPTGGPPAGGGSPNRYLPVRSPEARGK